MIEKALWEILSADTAVVSLVEKKIFPLVVPQKTVYPALVYSLISDGKPYCQDNKGILKTTRWQLSAYAQTYEKTLQIDEAVNTLLDEWKGIREGFYIHISFITKRDLYQEEAKIYHRAIDYRIIYKTIN